MAKQHGVSVKINLEMAIVPLKCTYIPCENRPLFSQASTYTKHLL